MTLQDDQISGSQGSQPDAKPAPDSSTDADANTAAGSSPDGDKDAKPDSLLDVLRNVVEKDGSESSPGKPGTAQADAKQPDGTQANPDGTAGTAGGDANDPDKDLPFNNHPRWKAIVAERDALRGGAIEYGQIQQFMHDNGLTPQEVAQGYQVMALLKNDPAKAREALIPIITVLNQFVGESLMPDLQAKVDTGELDEGVARLLAKERSEYNAELARLTAGRQAQERAAQESLAQSLEAQRLTVGKSVVDWENSIKGRDADWAKKEPFVLDRVRALMASGAPTTASEAVALAQKAYDEVNKHLSSVLPAKQPTRVATSAQAAGGGAKPQAGSLREAIALSLSRSG